MMLKYFWDIGEYNTTIIIMVRYCATLLFAIALMAGCASMDSVMSSWVGRSIDDVTAAWGAPESKMSRADGGATYTWTTFSSNQYGVRHNADKPS
jgi:hypothetical protein